MQQTVIESLPPYLKSVKILKDLSFDKTNSTYMTESAITAIDFDKVPKRYNRFLAGQGKTREFLNNSNDALYITADTKLYFIEFKNGTANEAQIHSKIYDSVNMLIDMGYLKDLEECRTRINYILVFNSEDYKNKKPESLSKIAGSVTKKAGVKPAIFRINKFKNYLFKDVRSCDIKTFEEEILPDIEQ